MQLVYSPHKLEKFFFAFKNVYLILIFCCILNVARHQSFISEETEQERPLIHKKCKTSFAQCKFMSCWKPSGNLSSIGATKKQLDYPSFHHMSDSYKAQNLRKSLLQNLFIKGLL